MKPKFFDRLAFSYVRREQLYNLLSNRLEQSGAILENLLELYIRQCKRRGRGATARVVSHVLEKMARDGVSFSKAMQPYIQDDEYSLLVAGESHDRLTMTLKLLLKIKNQNLTVHRAFRQPLLFLSGAILLVLSTLWIIAFFIMPDLLQALDVMSAKSRDALETMQGLTDFVTGWPIIITIVGTFIAIYAFVYSLRNWTGAARRVLERFPPYSLYRNVNGYAWMCSYLALVQAGEKEDYVLLKQMRNASPWLKERLSAIYKATQSASFPDALNASGYNFPSEDMIDEIAISWGTRADYGRLIEATSAWGEDLQTQALHIAQFIKVGANILVWVAVGGFTILSLKIGQ